LVQDLHKQTIRLWKMVLYWHKRNHMCFNTPFLDLDMPKVIRSIKKVRDYIERKLPSHEFVHEKSEELISVILHQVKHATEVVDFLKELKRESLQHRHWVQIFNLIKAPHLKNSHSFTITNLREYHI